MTVEKIRQNTAWIGFVCGCALLSACGAATDVSTQDDGSGEPDASEPDAGPRFRDASDSDGGPANIPDASEDAANDERCAPIACPCDQVCTDEGVFCLPCDAGVVDPPACEPPRVSDSAFAPALSRVCTRLLRDNLFEVTLEGNDQGRGCEIVHDLRCEATPSGASLNFNSCGFNCATPEMPYSGTTTCDLTDSLAGAPRIEIDGDLLGPSSSAVCYVRRADSPGVWVEED